MRGILYIQKELLVERMKTEHSQVEHAHCGVGVGCGEGGHFREFFQTRWDALSA